MDETLAIIESLGKRLADCRDVPAEVATVGCELHKVLLQHSGDGCGGDGPASEQLQGRASELLAEVLIVLLEATLRCGEDRDTQMKEMKVVESLLKEPLNNTRGRRRLHCATGVVVCRSPPACGNGARHT
ncbi:hypothetical protein ERJ75_001447900 [Trypanosoma vivax]|nr:hypothetical protein ERJ75_001447900 [Trypanosoma vivax]